VGMIAKVFSSSEVYDLLRIVVLVSNKEVIVFC